MADTHLQVNPDASLVSRKTTLWASGENERKQIITSIFEQKNWTVNSIEHINGAFWKVETFCQNISYKINLYISSVRDEARQNDEFKMQLGNSYPEADEPGWITLILGIYSIDDGNNPIEYILSAYNRSSFNFATNPSIRGTRTVGLQKALIMGFYKTDRSILFRPDFIYYFIENQDRLYGNYVDSTSASLSSSTTPLSTLNPATLTSFHQQLLSAIRTKPFVLLAGISGTGKSRIVRELARCCWADDEEQRNAQEPKNFMMIQVRPNWHDSTELIGYVSRINGEKYIAGDFIKFVARAWQDPGRPYFLCLDEMNLAPVEQYFAEYLSIIESRKLKNGKIVTDAIISPDYKSVDGEKIVKEYYDNLIKELIVECPDDKKHALYIQFKTDGISIPQNLIVIGTVNMDETTYSFSRKVLDRAMTLEMNEVDMWGGLVDDESFNFGNLEKILADAVSDEKVAYQQDKELCDKVLEYLENVNKKLEGTPFKIAYRTRNEFLMYALNRKSLAKDDDNVYVRTIDEMTSMKILSRIEGDFEKTSNVLDAIKKILETKGLTKDNSISLKKIIDMELKLKSGYTSYWA